MPPPNAEPIYPTWAATAPAGAAGDPQHRENGCVRWMARLAHDIGPRRTSRMLWTIFVVLLVLWLLGMVSSYTLGGFIHILLVIAIAVVLIRVIQGRRPV
jgi:hypothetical protein